MDDSACAVADRKAAAALEKGYFKGQIVPIELKTKKGVVRKVTETALEERLQRLIVQMGPLPPVGDLVAAQALEAIRHDKKVVNGRLKFVAAKTIGDAVVLDDVSEDELRAALVGVGLR